MTNSANATETADTFPCAMTGKVHARKDLIPIETLRPSLAERLARQRPNLAPDALISREAVDLLRLQYVEELLKAEHGEITELDRQVAESIAKQDTIAENIEAGYAEQRTVGERWSDALAAFGGSWSFLIFFFCFILIWIAVNVLSGPVRGWDAYPFILLNLILSCIAAVQAPIIMMSQRRQEMKDRMRSLNDYRVNLKAELEIRHLHEKVDHLITKQWQRLAEIQQIQLELMQERHGNG